MDGYRLGVDLGTTWTAAAVGRGAQVTVVSLSQRSPAVPTVVHVAADGSTLVGDAAVRRGLDEPERVGREMKRRIGDPAPILLGGSPWSPEQLQTRVLRWVVDQVTAEQGAAPTGVTVTHPANWGAFKLDLLAQAARQADLPGVDLRPEPVAAAAWYASQHRLADGEAVAVYDLGGGTFDTAVVRRVGSGFEILGRPDGIERMGGIDFDAAVLDHVAGQVGDAWTALDPADPEARADAAELRARCIEAKEALSADAVALVPVRLPGARTTVRVTRDELEAMIRSPLRETITALRRTLASAGVTAGDLAAVLLVGGSSRIPLVSELVAAEIGAPVAVDANPKFAVALGAALLAAETAAGSAPVTTVPAVTPTRPADAAPAANAAVLPPAPAAPVADPPPPAEPARSVEPDPVGALPEREVGASVVPDRSPPPGGRARLLIAVAAVATVALIAAVALTRAGDGGGETSIDASNDDPASDDPSDAAADEAAAGDGTLRIGVVLPETGSFSFAAPALNAAAEEAVDDVNGAGGAVDGDVVLLTQGADADDLEAMTAAAQQMIDEGADVIVGPVSVADQAAVCATDTTIDAVSQDDGGRTIRTVPSQGLLAQAIAQALVDDGRTSVGIVAPDDIGNYKDAVIQAILDSGVTVEPIVTYTRGALDPEDAVARLNDSGSTEAVLLGDGELAELIDAGQSSGYLGPFYGDEFLLDAAVGVRVSEGVAAGTELLTVEPTAHPVGVDPDLEERVRQHLADEGAEDDFPYYAAYVYDCIVLAAVAAEAAGSDHADAISSQWIDESRDGEGCATIDCLALAADTDIDYDGASGALDLDDDGEPDAGQFDRWRWNQDAVKEFQATITIP